MIEKWAIWEWEDDAGSGRDLYEVECFSTRAILKTADGRLFAVPYKELLLVTDAEALLFKLESSAPIGKWRWDTE